MTENNDGLKPLRPHDAVFDHLRQALQTSTGIVVKFVRLFHDQHDRLLLFEHEVPEFSLAKLGLLGDLQLLVGVQVTEECDDQRAEREADLLDRDRF
jgi:hypothetical protein